MSIEIDKMELKEKLALVCLYYARLPSNDERYRGKYASTLKLLSERYNVKYSSIRNNKDRYDSVFDNGRQGWHQVPLQKQSAFLYDIYLRYKDMPINELQKVVEKILDEAKSEGQPFYSIKTKTPEQVKAILNREQNIEIDGLNILKSGLKTGQIVFIVLGGDKGQSWVTWETGLVGMGIISAPPYDEGYEGKNYKIRIDVKVLLDTPIKREDLKPYNDTYDIIGIGPITKWEPNQAISQIAEKNAVALMRAMLELCPGIEHDLEACVDSELMSRIKGSTVKLVPMEFDFNESLPRQDEEESTDDLLDDFSDKYEPDISTITDGFIMKSDPIISMKNLINAGKQIIFTGPPGTGKTTLAERACQEAVRTSFINGYFLTTAISDWTTFDTIGGYMPDKDGRLQFQEGVFLKSIRENKWLIIDEINRAEVDKAFGHFFTVLSGMDVELQYKVSTLDGEKTISIKHVDTLGSYYDAKTGSYCIGRNWRIIATMNTYDKNSLFMLSYAFMRRFAFVHIDVPTENEYASLINKHLGDHKDIADIVLQLVKTSPKKLGAAIIIDLISYIKASGYKDLVNGICSLIIPQYEGISFPQIKQLYQDIGMKLSVSDRGVLMSYLCEFYDIKRIELQKIKFSEGQDSSVEEDMEDSEE